MLAVSAFEFGSGSEEEIDAPVVAPDAFRAGHFTLTSEDWTGRPLGERAKQDGGSFGIDSGIEGNDPTAFDPSESWSFQLDRAGLLMGIEFDQFTVDDADRAQLVVGQNEPVAIEARWVVNGYWRPEEPLPFEAGDIIRLEALQPTVEDLAEADALRREWLADPTRSDQVPEDPPQSVWSLKGLNVIGPNDQTFGGYIDLTRQVRTERAVISDETSNNGLGEDFGGMGSTVTLSGVDVNVTGFAPHPTDPTKLRVSYTIGGSAASVPFEINVHRSSNGSDADGPDIFGAEVTDSAKRTVGPHDIDIDVPAFDDIEEDYYLVAEADVDDNSDANDRTPFQGGVFISNDGVVHFQGTATSAEDSFVAQFNADTGNYEVWWNESLEHSTANPLDISGIHVRSHAGVDEIDVADLGLAVPLWAFGGAGNDNIYGGVGSDVLDGGAGYDTIYGNGGQDELHGGGNSTGYGDYLLGGDDHDVIHGDVGPDYIDGGSGDDILYGGDEYEYPGAYGDILYGGAGDDILYGDDGHDDLYGGDGNDILYGDTGDDSLYGQNGNDLLLGETGHDFENWGQGYGGPHDSLVVTTTVDESDTLGTLNFRLGSLSLREALAAAYAQTGDDDISFDMTQVGPTITLAGTQLVVDSNVDIIGPGADQLAVSGNYQSRVLLVSAGTTVLLHGIAVTKGSTTGRGGGIHNSGGLTLDGVMVIDNHSVGTVGSSSGGGGMYSGSASHVTIINSTFANNTSIYDGGGLRAHNARDNLEIINSTFSENEVTGTNRAGGAIWLWENSSGKPPITMVNTTITENMATTKGGGFGLSGASGNVAGLEIHNTIVAANDAGTSGFDDGDGALESASSYNLLGAINNGSPGTTDPSNQFNITDPGLAPLGDYGGSTWTHVPLPDSLAINEGSNTEATSAGILDGNDQRGLGYRRQLGSTVDIGAVEAQVVQSSPTSAIVVYGTDGADGIHVGPDANGNDVAAIDTAGGFEFPLSISGAASLSIFAYEGDDVVSVDRSITKAATIEGGDGDDLLVGGSGNDTIRGGLGADTIHGGNGTDTLYGYLDSSTYLGGDGADSFFAKGDGAVDVVWVEYGSDIYETDLTDDVDGANAPAVTADDFETIIKDENAGFGLGWDLADMDRLVIGTAPVIRWIRSDGYFIDFDDFNEIAAAVNDETLSVISDEGTHYLRRDKFGNEFHYQKGSANGNEGVLLKSLDRLGVGYEYTYGTSQPLQIQSITLVRPGQLGETTVYDYNGGSRVQAITDPFGRTTDLVYNGTGRLEQILLPAPNPSQPSVRPTFEFEYDALGFLSSVTDADGRETLYDMDHVSLSGTGELTITYPDDGVATQLPVQGDAYNAWRSQLGNWAMFVPEFKYKFLLDSSPRTGYQVDPLGRTTTFEMAADGFVVEMTDPAGQVTEYTRNSVGLLTQVTVTAADGVTVVSDTQYVYSPVSLNLTRVEYMDGTFETWSYDSEFSQVTEHVDQLGRRTLFDIDEDNGNINERRIVVGLDDRTSSENDDLVTRYEYEEDGLLKTVIELRNDVDGTPQLSLVTQYAYTDVSSSGPHIGRWLETITYGGDDPAVAGLSLVNAATVEFTHNNYGMIETVEDEVNRVTTYEHDDLDRLTKVTLPNPGSGQAQPVLTYTYLLSGLLEEEARTWVGGSTPITTHLDYDLAGRLESIFQDYGGDDEAETFYDYDYAGNVTEIRDANGHSTYFTYDVLNRPIRIVEPDPDGGGALAAPVTLLAYDSLGRLIAQRNPVGQITRQQYDPLGRLTAEHHPLGATFTYMYDDAGQLFAATDPQGRLTRFAYDDAGRMTAMWEPGLDEPTTYAYDTASNLRLVTDPLSHVSESTYDERGRVTSAIDANEDSTDYTYTNANELETLTDPVGNETTWAYDDAGRVETVTNELSKARSYLYDGYGRLQQYTDRNGRVTTYEYDNLHQLEAEKWWNGITLARTISYDFDLVGNLLSVSDPSATYDFAYDNLNRLTGVEQSVVGLTPTIVFENEYDAAGRMTASSAEIGGTADYANSYVRDALHRLVSLTQTDNGGNAVSDKRVDFTFGPQHQLTAIARYTSTSASNLVASSQFSYDEFGRLITINHESVDNYTEELGYGYDGANRLDYFSSQLDGYSVDYAYDDRGQLEVANYTGGPADETYGYDENGNRDTGGFTVTSNNRILSDGTYNYEYDDEGNLIKRTHSTTYDRTVYVWDHRNRLTWVVDYDGNNTATAGDDTVTQIVGNEYDAFNQWVGQVVDRDGNYGTTADLVQTVFVYQDGQIVLEFNDDGSGNLSAVDLAHRYLWGQAADQLLADEVIGEDTLWAMTDHLGTVRDVVDSDGTLRKHTRYSAFGEVTDEDYFDSDGDPITATHDEAIAQLLGFTGRPLDRFTGLQNNLHRWYDAATGKWLSEDPIGFAAGDANLYRYVRNGPIRVTDPKGLFTVAGEWSSEKSGSLWKPIWPFEGSPPPGFEPVGPGGGWDEFLDWGKDRVRDWGKDRAKELWDSIIDDSDDSPVPPWDYQPPPPPPSPWDIEIKPDVDFKGPDDYYIGIQIIIVG